MAAPTVTQRVLSDSKDRTVTTVHIATGGDTDLTTTLIVDTSVLNGGGVAATSHTIRRIKYSLSILSVTLLFDATTDVPAVTLSGSGELDLRDMGGITNNGGTGVTGDILMATKGDVAAATGFFTIETSKVP